VGYDDVFSIEHEDPMLSALEGVEKSVEFLRNVLIKLPRSRAVAH
jgi:sugar phosphate isomerase/epimerase